MFATYHDDLDFDRRHAHRPRRKSHPVFAALMFIAAYFTTITVQAQPQDAIQLNSNNVATVVGTVKEANDNYLIVTSAGKDMKIVLDDVHMQGEADTVFTAGQTVTVDGMLKGDDFGMPLMKAKTVTATSPAAPVSVQ